MIEPGPTRLFALRAFMRFWSARLASTAGSQMLMVAIGWQMYELTGSAWDLGLVGLMQFAPALALPAGALAGAVSFLPPATSTDVFEFGFAGFTTSAFGLSVSSIWNLRTTSSLLRAFAAPGTYDALDEMNDSV